MLTGIYTGCYTWSQLELKFPTRRKTMGQLRGPAGFWRYKKNSQNVMTGIFNGGFLKKEVRLSVYLYLMTWSYLFIILLCIHRVGVWPRSQELLF